MTNFGDGTIFERIMTINEEMSQKLHARIDLRNDAICQELVEADPVQNQNQKEIHESEAQIKTVSLPKTYKSESG